MSFAKVTLFFFLKYADLPEWSQLLFKVRMAGNIERACQLSLHQPVASAGCMEVTEEGHVFAPYVEFEVESMEEEVAKSYPTQSQPLRTPSKGHLVYLVNLISVICSYYSS